VDDEAPARALLREFLAVYPQFVVAAECANGYEAVKAVAEHRPELLFLDIQMPKLDGFEVLELLDRKPYVVFVTAYDEYAIRAFQVHAIDYLLKPFTPARFAEVVAHAEAMVRRGAPANTADATASVRKPLQRIAFKDGATIDVVPVQRIDYIEAQDDPSTSTPADRSTSNNKPRRARSAPRSDALHPRASQLRDQRRASRASSHTRKTAASRSEGRTRVPVSRAGYSA
jgi:two-component system LytT family response regulator